MTNRASTEPTHPRVPDRAAASSEHDQRAGVSNLVNDLLLPTLLFMALGGMTWAVRGSSGFGAVNGCVFAGVTWGAAWWFISRDPAAEQSRRYSSAWIVLALTVGIGISGNRGWMQWPSFFEGHLQLNSPQGRFAPIPRSYGFLWLFIAGVPWAGIGACLLAWCARKTRLRPGDWGLRLGCGLAGAVLARALFEKFPDLFLPLHQKLAAEYADLQTNPNLRRLIGDNRAALLHLGCYLGFLGYELGRRDWKNVKLISIVGVVNGLGWAVCQNWRWAAHVWPQANFNWWRCWESCGGLSIGAAYGLAYYAVNRRERKPDTGYSPLSYQPSFPRLEKFALHSALLLGLGLSLKNGLKGWANIYLGNEEYWNSLLSRIIGLPLLLAWVTLAIRMRLKPLVIAANGDLFPNAYAMVWIVLLLQNVIAQLVTGPATVSNEMAFKIYYLLLMLLSAVILHFFYVTRKTASQ
jgi:hypothetical protein